MRLEVGDVVFFLPSQGNYVKNWFPDFGPYRITHIEWDRAKNHDLDWIYLDHLHKKPGPSGIPQETHALRLRRDEFLTAVRAAALSNPKQTKEKNT